MLDEVHYDIPQDASHPNLYTLGRISEHNVVMVCLPTGQIRTTAVAGQMMAKFSSVQHILIVGIGGGIPRAETDIRDGWRGSI
jgi:nucleoside phosphorylase